MGRIDSVTSPEFNNLFRAFRYTAFRLETLQQYDVSYEEEPFAAFLAGDPVRHDPGKNEWVQALIAGAENGKTFSRVHIVQHPLTDYLRYEILRSYPPNVEAGEDIRILVGTPDGLGLPASDFWLFDSQDLWTMAYGPSGEFLYAEQVHDAEAIVRANHHRDKALALAVPYADYVTAAPGLRHAS